MIRYRARLFGDLHVSSSEAPLGPLPAGSTGSLLALLLVNRGHPLPRDRAAAALWPDRGADAGRKTLRTTLWRLGEALAPDPEGSGEAVRADRTHVRLDDPEAWRVDAWDFEDCLRPLVRSAREITDDREAAAVADALELHRRPFLEGFPDRWCEDRRHRMRLLWLAGLEVLVRYRRRSACWDAVLLDADLVLRVDPLRETVHRELMFAHYARGDRASALRLYESFRSLLADELGVGPTVRTRRLHDRMLAGDPPEEIAPTLDS